MEDLQYQLKPTQNGYQIVSVGLCGVTYKPSNMVITGEGEVERVVNGLCAYLCRLGYQVGAKPFRKPNGVPYRNSCRREVRHLAYMLDEKLHNRFAKIEGRFRDRAYSSYYDRYAQPSH